MRKIFAILAFSLLSGLCFAKSLSIQVVQNNKVAVEDQVFAVSDWVEQTIVDFFYESGHIVTTSPCVLLSEDNDENKKNLMTALKDTFLGGMDVLIRVRVDYNDAKDNPNILLLDYIKHAEWTIYDSRSGKVITSGTLDPEPVTLENNNEKGITKFASIIAGDISSGLLKAKAK